ncbi:MAG: Hsp33 family molecular chaperone HslO [Gemmatimonadota bacterium]
MSTDYLVRATALEGRVRAFALDATAVVGELRERHDMFPVPTAAVGRAAMGALLLAAASLKEEDQLLTVEIRGGGPIGRIICTANGRGEVRGLASNPHVHADSDLPGKLNVAGVVGSQGYISVTKDLGMRDPYRGTVELQSGEVGDDLAYYLSRSEQIPSAVGLGVFVTPEGAVEAAGGFLIQLLPGLEEEEIAEIEREVAGLPHPTALIRAGVGPEEVLARVFGDRVEVLDSYPVRFACPCSRERFEAALVTLGSEELTQIVEEESEYTELVCHFCNEKYHFGASDMESILKSAYGDLA